MGGGRDQRKKQKGGGTAGKGADKTARKTEQNETKAQRRTQKAAQVLAGRCVYCLLPYHPFYVEGAHPHCLRAREAYMHIGMWCRLAV